jgi:hypothetical protein
MGTADFEKKSLGTKFFYFSKASYRVKCFLFYGFFSLGALEKRSLEVPTQFKLPVCYGSDIGYFDA